MPRSSTSWKKGQSGNPAGRKPKPTSELIAASLKGKPGDIIAKLEELATEGDATAAKYLADRLFPQTKAAAAPVSLPELEKAATLTDKAHAVLAAIGTGNIPPDVGRDLLTALSNVSKIIEIDDIIKRLENLEEATP